MYNSINFKIYVIEEGERRLLETAVVENISFRANDVNTASFSMIVNSLDAEEIPEVGTKVLIYAYGTRFAGNDFTKNFLNKNLTNYQQYADQNQHAEYEMLIFAGEIQSINAELESNIFACHFIFRYIFNCVGAEYLLKNLGFNSYKFYDPITQQIMNVAGIPTFADNNKQVLLQQLFTTDGHGDKWTRAKAIAYLEQNISSPYNDLIFNISYSSSTLLDLMNFDIKNNQILSHYDFIEKLCGQLFNFYFTYSETQDDVIVVNITIVSKATTDNADLVSFLNLHGTKLSAMEIKPPERLVLRYPFYATIDGFYQIFRHPDNVAGDEYYTYELEKVNDDTDIESVFLSSYKKKGEHWTSPLSALSATPIPERVDDELKNSLGSKMGCHSKFFLHPLTTFNINGADVLINIEDFDVLKLNDFLRAVPIQQGYNILPWNSAKPFKDMTIKMDGNQIEIDCDIPHQVAPSDFIMFNSQIEKPVFPINDGDYVYVNANVKSKNNREYVSVGEGIETRFVDVDFVPTDPMILANYLYSFISNPLSSLTFNGTMIEALIDYFFCFGKKIDKIYFYAVNEGIINQPIFETPQCSLMSSGFSINRNGSYYTFSLEANKGEIDLNEVLSQLRFKFEIVEEKNNTLNIQGNFDTLFYGKIIDIKDNHYVVLPEWADNENDTIDVARIDEHKLGYWLNNPPSDKVEFALKYKNEQQTEYEYSERYENITTDDGTVQKINKIVPDEKLFNIIAFKVGVSNVYALNLYGEENTPKYFIYVDTNQYARSWAVVPDDEDNYYG